MLKEFYHKYIELNLKDYPNIGIDLEINKLLFFVFLALIAASVFASYIQASIALMVKKLLRTSSFSEESSKTLADLGLDKHKTLKFALTRATGSAALIIREAGKRTPTYEEYIDIERREKELKKEKKKQKKANRPSLFSSLKKLDSVNSRPAAKNGNSTNPALEATAERSADTVTAPNENVEASIAPVESANAAAVRKGSADTACINEANDSPVSSKELLRRAAPDFDTARFYIPSDMEERALRYYNTKQGSITKTVLSCLGLFAFYIALVFLMPTALSALSSLLGG